MDFSSKKIRLELVKCDQCAEIAIYHSIGCTEEIESVIRKMIEAGTLTTLETAESDWILNFLNDLLSKDHLYFRTDKEQLFDRRQIFIRKIVNKHFP